MQYLKKLKAKFQKVMKLPISVIKRPFVAPVTGRFTPVLIRDLTKLSFKSKMIRDEFKQGVFEMKSARVTLLMGVQMRLAYLEAPNISLDGLYPVGIDNVRISDAWEALADELVDLFDGDIQWVGYRTTTPWSKDLVVGLLKDSELAIVISDL